MANEAELELYYATKLSLNLGEGLKVLKPVSINAAIKHTALPSGFTGLREWSRDLTATMAEKKPKQLVWRDLYAEDDIETYVSRKVWENKVATGSFVNPSAASIAASTFVSRHARTQLHEAINHSVKHNTQIEHLLPEMHEHIDSVVLGHMNGQITKVAMALCSLHPELGELMQQLDQKVLTHDIA